MMNSFDTIIYNGLKAMAHHWRIFLLTFLIMLFARSEEISVAGPEKIVTPLPHTIDTLDKVQVRSKIENISNRYSLKEKTSFLPKSYASEEYENAASYVVVDYNSGDIIAEKALHTRLPMASITKVMTAVVSLDLAREDEIFTVTPNAAAQIPTKLVFTPGEQFTLNELLHASLLTSANDATEVIREGVDQKYNEQIFIKAMNAKAEFLGLKDSHFSNPQGFDAVDHYSTANDLAILAHYALTNYPLINEIVAKDYAHLSANTMHKSYDLYNWNGLIGVYPEVRGIKIGNTGNAKYTTMVISERNNKALLAVVLGAPDIIKRDSWAASLLDLGYEVTMGLNPIDITSDDLFNKYSTWRYGS